MKMILYMWGLVLLLSSSFVHASELESEPSSVRILPLGDSLTSGLGYTGTSPKSGYRRRLYVRLENLGYNVDFLGESITVWDEELVDNDHEGHFGWTIAQTDEYLQDIADGIPDPDIILLLIGSVDMTNADYEDAIQRWDTLMKHIATIWPHTHILASNLIHRDNDEHNARIDDSFNPYVESIVNEHRNQGTKVTFVDMASLFTKYDLVDSMHLKPQSYREMGNRWAEYVHSVMADANGDRYAPDIIRAEGSMDREHVDILFSKPLHRESARIENFSIDGDLIISDCTLDDDNRKITLKTTKQAHGKVYKIRVLGGVSDRTNQKLPYSDVTDKKIRFEAGWRFLVLSDWHSAEKHVFPERTGRKEEIAQDLKVIKYLKRRYGGDFIAIAGDTNAGAWDRIKFKQMLSIDVGYELNATEAVLEGGRRCYGGMLTLFRQGGYSKVLLAHGDHEAGDNPWKVGEAKSKLQPAFREAVGMAFNRDRNGYIRYRKKIGSTPSRPLKSIFSETAYAYLHKNALIVTVDAFYQESPDKQISEMGTVANRIVGEQLEWLDYILDEGRKLSEVKHIIVQAHAPVLHPVRKNRSSGQMMELEEKSEFWLTLKKYSVDIYFTGEVHLNTVTKDKESNLIQIASRGNYFNNFLTVDISDDSIDIKCHNEIGDEEIKYNLDYEVSGRLTITKTDSDGSKINAWGELNVLDQSAPMLHFDFEEIVPLDSQTILGLGLIPDVPKYTPRLKKVPVNGIECQFALKNVGEFGVNYDAQVGNISLVRGVMGKAGKFVDNSRAGIWGMGPHFGGREVSYSIWFQTEAAGSPVLISYEGYWLKKTVMNLRLVDGRPELVMSKDQRIVANIPVAKRLNDGDWHHIVVSHTIDDGMLSEMKMYINGAEIETILDGKDEKVSFPNGGVVSLGGFGHGRTSSNDPITRQYRVGFTDGEQFVGLIDEVSVWARAISREEVRDMFYFGSGKTSIPTRPPTISLTAVPSPGPTGFPTDAPSLKPTAKPTAKPTSKLTSKPTSKPTATPTTKPTSKPTKQFKPSSTPTLSKPPSRSPQPSEESPMILSAGPPKIASATSSTNTTSTDTSNCLRPHLHRYTSTLLFLSGFFLFGFI